MVKKLLSLIVAIMLFSVTALTVVQAAPAGKTKTYTIYNTVDGTTQQGAGHGLWQNKDGVYEDVRVYSDAHLTGRDLNINANMSQAGYPVIAVGHDSYGEWASFLRFPLDNLSISENEIVTKVELKLATTKDSQIGKWTVSAYSWVPGVAFGESLTAAYNKTFGELTAAEKLDAVTVIAPKSYTAIDLNVTDYVDGLLTSNSQSADFYIAAPDSAVAPNLEIASGSVNIGAHLSIKPRLVITTAVKHIVNDFSDSVITWNNENGTYTVTTTTTEGTAKLIVASFNENGMVDVKIAEIDAATAKNGVISEKIGALKEGTIVKAFLWNPTTLVPIKGVTDL